jgi:hypothetical protein
MDYHGTSKWQEPVIRLNEVLGIPMIRSLVMLVSAKQRERYIDACGSMTKRTS